MIIMKMMPYVTNLVWCVSQFICERLVSWNSLCWRTSRTKSKHWLCQDKGQQTTTYLHLCWGFEEQFGLVPSDLLCSLWFTYFWFYLQCHTNAVIGKIMACTPHYVRCIKPSERKAPLAWNQQRYTTFLSWNTRLYSRQWLYN